MSWLSPKSGLGIGGKDAEEDNVNTLENDPQDTKQWPIQNLT